MRKKLPVRFRGATPDDANFIFNSWLKSYRNSQFARLITNTIYFTEQHKLIETLLKTCTVIMVCSQTDPNQIYGYSVVEEIDGILVIHYVYVKHSFRNMGIGNALMEKAGYKKETASIYTMHTQAVDRLFHKYNIIFHPYIVLKKLSEYDKGDDNEQQTK